MGIKSRLAAPRTGGNASVPLPQVAEMVGCLNREAADALEATADTLAQVVLPACACAEQVFESDADAPSSAPDVRVAPEFEFPASNPDQHPLALASNELHLPTGEAGDQ